MTVRFYIEPLERNAAGNQRGPKYFNWRFDPDPPALVTTTWSILDYGDIDRCVICAEMSTAQHNALVANADVLALPANLDSTYTVATRNAARTFLEQYNIPAGWISTGMTYRISLRIVSALFLYMQRVSTIIGHSLTLPDGWLDLTVSQIPAEIRDAMAQAASEQGFDYSSVTGSTTVRAVLKVMADAWGATPIQFSLATL